MISLPGRVLRGTMMHYLILAIFSSRNISTLITGYTEIGSRQEQPIKQIPNRSAKKFQILQYLIQRVIKSYYFD